MAITMEPKAIEPKIKIAMKSIGLEERTDDLLNMLDEIELDMMLKLSEEQDEKGLVIPLEEAERIMKERFASGYYGKQ